MTTSDHHPQGIHITVTFALAPKPYGHTYAPETPIGTVQADALTAFDITTDGTTTYEVLHDGAVVPPGKTVAEVAGHAHGLRLALRTVTISG